MLQNCDKKVRRRTPTRRNASAIGPKHLDIEVADLLAQRIAVDAKEVGGADLIAARGCQGRRQQRMPPPARHAMIGAGGRQVVAEAKKMGGQVAFDRRTETVVLRVRFVRAWGRGRL